MTKEELIEALNDYPDDLLVTIIVGGSEFYVDRLEDPIEVIKSVKLLSCFTDDIDGELCRYESDSPYPTKEIVVILLEN